MGPFFMKKTLIYALPLLIVVSIIVLLFGVIQVRTEESRLMDDLKRKAETVTESIELSARYVLINNDLSGAERLVRKFQNKKRIQGCALYDKGGNLIAITKRFKDWK